MKTQIEIEFKIAVHESTINDILEDKQMTDYIVQLIEGYLMGRKALLWVLNSDDFVTEDDFDKKVKFEISCYESTKIY